MELRNPAVAEDLERGRPLRLDLGSGGPPSRPGFYGVDLLPLEGVDVVADLDEPLDRLPDDSVAEVVTRHTLEHVRNLLPLMKELHRVVRADGTIRIVVPHFSNVLAFSDPTHVRFFGLHTMDYFVDPEKQRFRRKVPAFYTDVRFEVRSIEIRFYKMGPVDKLIGKLLGMIVNRGPRLQQLYERRLSALFHASEIEYVLRPEKPAAGGAAGGATG